MGRNKGFVAAVGRGMYDMIMYWTRLMVMLYLNIYEAKTHLSRYLEQLLQGEQVFLCKRNVPIAEIRALPKPILHKRPIGLAKGEFAVPSQFFEPLPNDVIAAFEG